MTQTCNKCIDVTKNVSVFVIIAFCLKITFFIIYSLWITFIIVVVVQH